MIQNGSVNHLRSRIQRSLQTSKTGHIRNLKHSKVPKGLLLCHTDSNVTFSDSQRKRCDLDPCFNGEELSVHGIINEISNFAEDLIVFKAFWQVSSLFTLMTVYRWGNCGSEVENDWAQMIQFIEFDFQCISHSTCRGLLQLGMGPDSLPIMLNISLLSVNKGLLFFSLSRYI